MISPVWKHYIGYFRDSLVKIVSVAIVSTGQSITLLLVALIVRYSFDEVFLIGDTNKISLVIIGLLAMILLNIGITLATRYTTRKITTRVISDLRNDLLDKLFQLPRFFFNDVDLARVHTSVVQYTQRLDVMNNTLVARSLPSLVIALGLMGVLLYLNWLFPYKLKLFLINNLLKYNLQQIQ